MNKSIQEFLYEPLPEGVGWPHILGSALLALWGLQFITGLLLSFVYAPSPLSAFQSVSYLTDGMEGGAWLRGIHYWGASAIVIVAALHLIRTYLYGAYRPPRRWTWVVGVLLFLCILAFGQTGYLLPWDQRAYWGTSVTIRIVATAPFIGEALAYLLKGGPSVGALTLSRFYSIHVIALPFATTLLVIFHLLLIRKHGITAPWSRTEENPERKIPFYPYQMARDAAGMIFVLSVVMLLAWLLPVPTGSPADPTDATFVPRPDWYFLALFQMLTFTRGKWEILGTFVIPTAGILLLLALPWIDRNPHRRLRHRPLGLFLLVIVILSWGALTYEAVVETPKKAQPPSGISPARSARIKRPSEVGGMYVLKQHCFECHSMTALGNRSSLQVLARNHFPVSGTWLQDHLQQQGKSVELTDKEMQELMSVMRLVTTDRAELLYSIPPKARFGGHFFYNKACINCHKIDGQGGEHAEVKAPDLTLRLLRTKEWHIKHIHDPRSLVRNSQMPPFFHYEDYEYDALAEYLLYLHTP